jgi:hypothetical protein
MLAQVRVGQILRVRVTWVVDRVSFAVVDES